MWLDLTKQGLYVNLDDVEMQIEGRDDTHLLFIGSYQPIELTREERDMFVLLHGEAMDREENVFSFDQDRPKFKMKLSGDEDEMDADVGLE